MRQPRLRNLHKDSQEALRLQFSWLKKAAWDKELSEGVQIVSVCVFDHWLSLEECHCLLDNVSPEEQRRRDAQHAKFCALLAANTKVLSFIWKGRKYDRLTFREFVSPQALASYLTPNGARSLGHRMFAVVLPELGCAFFEGYDDTHHFYFTQPSSIELISEWAASSGVHMLQHS